MNALIIFFTVVFSSTVYASYKRGKPEHTHLVTMRKAEFLEIINCISESRDVKLCKELTQCSEMKPKQVIEAYKKCRKLYTGESCPTCRHGKKIFPSMEIASKVFDCTSAHSEEETPEEKLDMVKFEQCIRKLYSDCCKYQPKFKDEDIYFHDDYKYEVH